MRMLNEWVGGRSDVHAVVVRAMSDGLGPLFMRDVCDATSLCQRTVGFVWEEMRSAGMCDLDGIGRASLCVPPSVSAHAT